MFAIITILLQLSPLSFIVSDSNAALDEFNHPNHYRVGLWRISEDMVNNMNRTSFDSNIIDCQDDRTIIITINKIDILSDSNSSALFFGWLEDNHTKISHIQVGNEIDRNIEKLIGFDYPYEEYARQIENLHNSVSLIDDSIKLCLSFSKRSLDDKIQKQRMQKILSTLSLEAPGCIDAIDFHYHSAYNKADEVQKYISELKEIVLNNRTFEQVEYIMTENSTWTLSPYKSSSSLIKLPFQSEDQQASYLLKTSLIALSEGFKVVFFGVNVDRTSYKQTKKSTRFHYNGLYYNERNIDSSSKLNGGPKKSAFIYKLLNDMLNQKGGFQYSLTRSDMATQVYCENENFNFIFFWLHEEYDSDSNFEVKTPWSYEKLEVIDLLNFNKTDISTFSLDFYESVNVILPLSELEPGQFNRGRPYMVYIKN